MSPSPQLAPGLGQGVAVVFRFQCKRLVRGKKLRLGIVATALVVGAVVTARYAIDAVDPAATVRDGIQLGWFRLLVYLLPFLFTSGAIAEEVESRTFTYLAARPVGRVAIALGKYLAGTAMALGLTVLGLLVLHAAVHAADPTRLVEELPTTLRAAGAAALLVACYSAICLMWGSLAVEAAGIVSALYLAIVELACTFVPLLKLASMNHHAVALAGLDTSGPFSSVIPEIAVPLHVSAIVVIAATLLFLSLATLAVKTSEYRVGTA